MIYGWTNPCLANCELRFNGPKSDLIYFLWTLSSFFSLVSDSIVVRENEFGCDCVDNIDCNTFLILRISLLHHPPLREHDVTIITSELRRSSAVIPKWTIMERLASKLILSPSQHAIHAECVRRDNFWWRLKNKTCFAQRHFCCYQYQYVAAGRKS